VRVAHRPVFRPSEVLAAIGDHRPDVVFNLCEALGGDSRLEVHAAWLLDRLGLPFTGSPYHALRHCLYKVEANQILARAGVRVPATVRVDSPDHIPKVTFPVIVKPEREDGSTGIGHESVVNDRPELREQVACVIETYRQPAVVQRYIHGRELAVSLVGWTAPRVLPPGRSSSTSYRKVTRTSSHSPRNGIRRPSSRSPPLPVPAVLRPPELRRVRRIDSSVLFASRGRSRRHQRSPAVVVGAPSP
jgi:D-alanine-D-alanine ligase